MQDLSNKIAVITGGTQGLGAATAQLFAQRGIAGLVLCGRQQAKGHALADQLTHEHQSCKAIFITADLAETTACQQLINAAETQFDRLDILVNVAALTTRGNLLNTSSELFDRMIAINLRAPFFLMQHAAKVMRARQIQGSIINIGSISALAG
jgi:NAD(P)-dependent dehydrogenase (short-subunit alcohol dehydrogenase family)